MNTPLETKESLDRLRRIETRLWKLCEKLGVEPPPNDVPLAVTTNGAYPTIDLPGYDVSLSAIKHALERAGLTQQTPTLLYAKGVFIAKVVFYA